MPDAGRSTTGRSILRREITILVATPLVSGVGDGEGVGSALGVAVGVGEAVWVGVTDGDGLVGVGVEAPEQPPSATKTRANRPRIDVS